MISDFHLHTSHSGDSETPPRDQINQALSLGMKELGITDHHDHDTGSFCDIDFELDMPSYLEDLARLRREYQDRIQVRTGIELGLMCRLESYLRDFTVQYRDQLDFIIGSSHFARDMDPYYPEYWAGRTEEEAIEEFLLLSLKRVKKLCFSFDIYGHLDYVVRYAPHKTQHYKLRLFQDIIDETLKILIENGKGIECNTAGLKYGLGQPNPSWDILARYRELGGEILTVGSDAHKTPYLGFHFEECRQKLLALGYRYYTVFRSRKPVFLPLE